MASLIHAVVFFFIFSTNLEGVRGQFPLFNPLIKLDFPLQDIGPFSDTAQSYTFCLNATSCCGFNANGWAKFNCSLPVVSNLDFHIRTPLTKRSSAFSDPSSLTGTSSLDEGGEGTSSSKSLFTHPFESNTVYSLPSTLKVPSARQYHSAVLLNMSSFGPSIVVFGGFETAVLGDLWAYSINQRTWTQLEQSCQACSDYPNPRYGHTAIAINSTTMFVFGGNAGVGSSSSVSNDLWSYTDGIGWKLISALGTYPTARFSHSALLLDSGDMLIVGGFLNASSSNPVEIADDYYLLNLNSLSWSMLNISTGPRRANHLAANVAGSVILMNGAIQPPDYMFQGYWMLNYSSTQQPSWERVNVTFNGTESALKMNFTYYMPRASLAVTETNFTILTGIDQSHEPLLLGLDPFAHVVFPLKPSPFGAQPFPRWAQTSTYYGGQIFIFGGSEFISTATNQLYSFDTASFAFIEQLPADYTPYRQGHGAVTCGESVYVFGGTDGSTLLGLNTTLRFHFHPKQWSLYPVTTLANQTLQGRIGHTVSKINETMFLTFGGLGGETSDTGVYFHEVWALNVSGPVGQWSLLSQNTSIKGRAYHGACMSTLISSSNGNQASYLFVYGGITVDNFRATAVSVSSDFHVYDLNKGMWLTPTLNNSALFDRYGHSMLTNFTYHTQNIATSTITGFIYGGCTALGEFPPDLITFTYHVNTNALFLSHIAPVSSLPFSSRMWPPPRIFQSALMLNATKFIVFGGATRTSSFNDLWLFDSNTSTTQPWTQLKINQSDSFPLHRYHHRVSHKDDYVFIIGGLGPAPDETNGGIDENSTKIDSISKPLLIRLGCNRGSTSPDFLSYSCVPCPDGFFALNSTYCQPCPGDSYTFNDSATSVADCVSCLPNACHNHGSCHLNGAKAVCTCHFLYAGSHDCSFPVFPFFLTGSLLGVLILFLILMYTGNYIKNRVDVYFKDKYAVFQEKKILYQDLTNLSTLSSSTLAVVCKATWEGITVAVKVSQMSRFDESDLNEYLEAEANVFRKINYDHVLRFYGSGDVFGKRFYVMEFTELGSLDKLLNDADTALPLAVRYKFVQDVIRGMNFLHRQRVVHCDLKSGNVFITGTYSAKIGDFGMSHIYDPQRPLQGHAFIGTVRWQAPELLRGEQFDFSIDVYSFGILVWEVVTRFTVPFPEIPDHDVAAHVLALHRPDFSTVAQDSHLTRALVDIAELCWNDDPTMRPSFLILFRRYCETSLPIDNQMHSY